MNFNNVLAWFLTGSILLFWFCILFIGLPENGTLRDAIMMIVGAQISGFTLILQFYFRKRSGGD